MVDRVRIAAPLELWRDSDFPVSFTAEAFFAVTARLFAYTELSRSGTLVLSHHLKLD